MLRFPILDIQMQTQKPLEKEAWKQASQNTHFLIQGTQKTFKMESLNPLRINENPSMDLKVSFLVLPNVPGSPQGPPGRQSEATKHAK